MHNIKELRKNLSTFKKKLLDRNFNLNTDLFETLDGKNRKLISEKEKLEQEKGILSKSKDKSNFEKSKKISEKILKLSQDQLIAQKKLNELIHFIPNIAQPDVPIGKDEKSNKLIKKFGKLKYEFDKDHNEVGKKAKLRDQMDKMDTEVSFGEYNPEDARRDGREKERKNRMKGGNAKVMSKNSDNKGLDASSNSPTAWKMKRARNESVSFCEAFDCLVERELSIDQQMKMAREAAKKRNPNPDHKAIRGKMLQKALPKDTRTDAQKMTDATGPRPGSRYRGD